MGSTRGHPAIGAIAGLILGIALAFDLLLMGTVRLDSTMVVILPVAFLVIGTLAGFFAPLRFGRR